MKQLAYLVNQYPAISHTFVRREIRALESLGYRVARFSIRAAKDGVITEADQEESERTTVLLQSSKCLFHFGSWLVRHPFRLLETLLLAGRLRRRAGGRWVRYLAYVFEAAHLAAALNRQSIDHLHVHFGTNSTTVAMLCHRLGGPPFSFTVHGPEEFDRPEAESLRAKIVAAKFVIAISSFGRSQLQRWCPYSNWPKIHVVHCGLDSGFIQHPTTSVPDLAQLVCVGRLSEQKGHFVLLQAARELSRKRRDFNIVLVGDGPFRAQLQQYAAKANLTDQIRFVGWQNEREVQIWLEQSRCLVLPSFAEGLPVVIMEALAMGRPVITTYVAGIPELVEDGRNGWLVPAGDPLALTQALCTALTLPADRLTEMGLAGQAKVRKQHDIKTEAAKLQEIIESV